MYDLKIGEGAYAPRGLPAEPKNLYVIVGMPKLRRRWITVAPIAGGGMLTFPERDFDERFRRVD